jgi:hypothetical protein
MFLEYINIRVPYSRLFRILNIQPFGASGRNLLYLSQIDVEVIYREGSMGMLKNLIQSGRPCIALVRTEFLQDWTRSTDHAVVVVGIDDDNVFYNDPTFNQHPMRVTSLEFDLAWMEMGYRYRIMTTGNTPRA